jgi:hypothetical protein
VNPGMRLTLALAGAAVAAGLGAWLLAFLKRRLIVYTYEVAAVTYEAAQDISPLSQVADAAHGLAGQTVSVKYDPRRPANSILACEEWSGISLDDGTRNSGLGTGEKPESVPSPEPNA